MGKKALVIGIDDYPGAPLAGCVGDAKAIAALLARNADAEKTKNFDVKTLFAPAEVTADAILNEITALFRDQAETAVLYFAGHGLLNPNTNAGYLVSIDGQRPNWGVPLAEILTLANGAYPRIGSTVIILDCCHSGYMGEVAGLPLGHASIIGTGVTILTASHREGVAQENAGRGVFTDILEDGLLGGCSDVCGNITPAALYSHVDQTLGPFEQRPIYKANVQNFITLRKVEPKVPLAVLRKLPEYFPKVTNVFPLDPSYEPDRQNIPEKFRHLPINEENIRVFRELQNCNRHGLVVPVDADAMYYAAIESTGCRLTAVGKHYWKLASTGRL